MAYTVVDPRAVVVHVQYATVACRAVMASLRLEDIAHKAVASALVFRVTQMEAPEDGNLTRVSCHCLDK